ncbi:uncharacterized protein LOC126827456 isoform X2 [Patella vulgata]|uniref:uncharacterized protein LOC126827456 isoform X2 n=2 Tax=Patella vulgata TaxID=6465 RepID=UPI0024A96610|nr:uncharacterized protein LOC126827456 isoform X2 [Patella vulgata]
MNLYYSLIFLLVFLLLCNVTFVHGLNNCSWIITENKVERHDIQCLQYDLPSRECELSGRDLPIQDDDKSVDIPINFVSDVTKVKVNSSSGIEWLVPVIGFSWNPPQAGLSLSYLKGFLLNALCLHGDKCLKTSFCVMFDLRQNNLSIIDSRLKFEWKTPPLNITMATAFEFRLYSLPRPKSHIDSARQKLLQDVRRATDSTANHSADWAANIGYKINKNDVEVRFKFSEFPFIHYTIYLHLKDNNTDIQVYVLSRLAGQVEGIHTFKNVSRGNYTIAIKPIDDEFNEDSKCLCYRGYRNHPDKRDCTSCRLTETQAPFFIGGYSDNPVKPTSDNPVKPTSDNPVKPTSDNPVKPTSDKPTSDNPVKPTSDNPVKPTSDNPVKPTSDRPTSDNPVKPTSDNPSDGPNTGKSVQLSNTDIGLIIMGITLLVILVIAVVILLLRRKCIKCGMGYICDIRKASCVAGNQVNLENLTNSNNGHTVTVAPLQKRSIFILNAEDHQHHVESVKQLVLFLQDECHCQPIYPPFCLKEIGQMNHKDWTLKTLDTVDYVMIVNSEASYYLMKAASQNGSYNYRPITSTGNLFTDFMKEVIKESKNTESLDRYIMVSFDHKSSEFYLSDIPTSHCYKIIQQIPDLVKYIHHQTPESDTYPQLQDVFTKSMDDFDAGKSLKDAVYKAAKFEKSNVTWFLDTFGEPYGRVYEKHDSGIGSFIGHEHDAASPQQKGNLDFPSNRDENGFLPPEDIRSTNSEPQFQTDVGEESSGWGMKFNQANDSPRAEVDEHGWFPPDTVSSYSEATADRNSFFPPDTLSEMETKSLSPSTYMRNMNARYEAAVNGMNEKDENTYSALNHFNEKDETDYYSNLKDTTRC